MVHGLETMRRMNDEAAISRRFSDERCQLRDALACIEELKSFARQELHDTPSHIAPATLDLNKRLINEEVREFNEACDANNFREYLDGLGDIVYVALGAIMSTGVDPAEIIRRICVSNSTKLGPDATIVNGKLIKSASYTPVNFDDLLTNDNKITK